MYRIRIDIVNDLNSDELLQVCGATRHVLVRHELPHGNPHFHAYIENDVKENTMRQRLKRKFPYLKPSDFSIKKCDPDRINEYVQYMFNTKHGNKWELIDTCNFDDQLINDLISNAQQISNDYEATLTQKKPSKPTIYDLAMEVRKGFTQKHGISDNPVENLGKSQAPHGFDEYLEHLNLAIKVCRKYRQPFEEHYLRRLVTTAICEGSSGRQTMIRKIMDKEFPNR